MKNTGKPSEQIFEGFFKARGKNSFVHRLTDAAEVYGMNKKFAQVKAQPADYVVTDRDFGCFYAEVKSTVSPTSFAKNLIKSTQLFAARQQVSAGGLYLIFVHALALRKWFCVPAQFVLQSEKASWKWQELEQFQFRIT